MSEELHVVTGAFGYSGKYIAKRLLAEGKQVRTLTNSLQRANPFAGQVEAQPYNFDQPEKLVESLRGAAVLYNTYWIRYNHPRFKQADAITNSLILFNAARQAGVGRIVHISITNPAEDSPQEYFRGKARLESALKDTQIPHTILRPAILFGGEDILINNIAWALRHLPIMGQFGDGSCRLQPIFVDDLAALAVEHSKPGASLTLDAIGPETYTFHELVLALEEALGVKRIILPMPPALAYAALQVLGLLNGDVMITWEEVQGLITNKLYTQSAPAGTTRLSQWMHLHKDTLGKKYASELSRRFNRLKAY